MDKILANAIEVFFKNMKEIPRMCYIISALILLAEIYFILFFSYKGNNIFYNFILIFANIILTGCLYGLYTIILETTHLIWCKNKKRAELINFIKSLSEEEYTLMSEFVLNNSTTIYPTFDQLDVIDGLNSKREIIKVTDEYRNHPCATITEEIFELLKKNL